MKVLEEYAIECSIAKVYGSEVLDYVVDEAVQIYGGYGFHEDYPVARGYRDSRVNRIFEGTNEINRMLIIQMLMKRALAGSLPLMAAGAKLQEEILSGSSGDDSSDGQWAEESRIVAGAKKVFLLAAGAAMQKYRERLADQQEIIGALADIVLELYAMESALLRAEKAIASRGDSTGAIAAAARVLLHDGAARVEASRADRAGRFGGRRYVAHSNGRLAPHDQARTCGHHRPAPHGGRCRGERRPLSLRRTLNRANRSARRAAGSESFVPGQKLSGLQVSG